MNFRSSNAEGFAHFPGDVMSGALSTLGVLLSSNTVSPVSDNTDENLVLKGKGAGGVVVGTSTSLFGGMNRGQSTMTLVALPVSAIVQSTVTIPGLGVDDLLFIHRPGTSLVSTAIGMVGYGSTAANEATISWLNNLASTASILANTPIKWNYIKAT
jgi:hypothetical protein